MDFRTELKLKPFHKPISYRDKILFLGSCFAENISAYFERYRFQVCKNPFGILYHPIAINQLVDIALDTNYKPEEYSFQHADSWSNFDAHSSLSKPEKRQLLEALNHAQLESEQAIKQSNFIFITLGTAWVYEHLEHNKIVANCHKLPQKYFEKRLLNLETVEAALTEMTNKINKVNTDVEIIFTVSPVRHLKEGFVNNQWSKSTLHLASQNLIKKVENTSYFPSYELILDDLRDYRFYELDMLHPNTFALDYVWSKIKAVYFKEDTQDIVKKIEVINKRLNHRFFNPNTKESLLFKAKTDDLIENLKRNHPSILI